jgi:hypothetical protein
LAFKIQAATSVAKHFGAGWSWLIAIAKHSEVKVATIIPGDWAHLVSLSIHWQKIKN